MPSDFNTFIASPEEMSFVSREAQLLDQADYAAWLSLWREDGLYIVPAAYRATGDPRSSLNIIYDDHDMRTRRVDRLLSGSSFATSPATRTVRSVSRVVRMAPRDGLSVIASSVLLIASRRDMQRILAAEVEHELDFGADSPRIVKKTVRLINADEAVTDVSFLL